jgi:hypothetical protein
MIYQKLFNKVRIYVRRLKMRRNEKEVVDIIEIVKMLNKENRV